MRSRKGKKSNKLADETAEMESFLKNMKIEMSKRKAANPEGFRKKGSIWGASKQLKKKNTRRKRASKKKSRKSQSSSSTRSRKTPRGDVDMGLDRNPMYLKKKNSLPSSLYSHHFSSAFKKEEEPVEEPSFKPKKLKRIDLEKSRKKDMERHRQNSEKKKKRLRNIRQKYKLMDDDEREKLESVLWDAFDTENLVPAKFTTKQTSKKPSHASIESVMEKRKIVRQHNIQGSLIGEIFEEWKLMGASPQRVVGEIEKSISSLSPSVFGKKKKKKKPSPPLSTTSTSSNTTTSSTTATATATSTATATATATSTASSTVTSEGGGGGGLGAGEYDEAANRAAFQEALKAWRGEETETTTSTATEVHTIEPSKVNTSTVTSTVTSGGVGGGVYDEKEQSRLFTEAVMEWRKTETSTKKKESKAQGGGMNFLYAGTFDIKDTMKTSKSEMSTGTGTGTESGTGSAELGRDFYEKFVERVRGCMVVTYFDVIEDDVNKRLGIKTS